MNVEAESHFLKSEYAEARNIHTEILCNTQNTGSYAFGLLNLAQIDIVIGERELHLREGETHTSKSLLQQSFTSVEHKDSQAALSCLESLADTNRWPVDDFEWALRWTVVYLLYAQGKKDKRALHKALQYLGVVFLEQGDLTTAGSLISVALETFTYMDIHRSRAKCLLCLGNISEQKGQSVEAVELWKEARPLFECSLQTKEMTKIDTKLALMAQKLSDSHQNSLAFLNKLAIPTISIDELVGIDITDSPHIVGRA
ncbi:hypothetical protein C8R44DRAFT_751636 [Mycena epipterygia]|nr:hypothetical protein C8R44DRAFT_751636 [Mycena epipterygia]